MSETEPRQPEAGPSEPEVLRPVLWWRILLLVPVSILVIAGIMLSASYLVADRLSGHVPSPTDARSTGVRELAASASPERTTVQGDSIRGQINAVLQSLADGHAAAGNGASAVAPDDDMIEQLRRMGQEGPIDFGMPSVEIPFDLRLPVGSVILFAVKDESGESGDGLVMARVPGTREQVAGFFRQQAAAARWTVSERPATAAGDRTLTLVVDRGPAGRRMIVIRPAASSAQCVVGIYDLS